MATCYRCGGDTFLKVHKEIIDGEEREVCGKCRDVVCFLCGKTKRNDGINRWSFEVHPETKEVISIGCCCTYVQGKIDIFKLYSEKYNNLKKNNPEILVEMDKKENIDRLRRQVALNSGGNADRLIDNWSKNVGRSRKKAQKDG